jgi:hypothetical protein
VPAAFGGKVNVDKMWQLMDIASDLNFNVGAVAGISRPAIVAANGGSLNS